MLVRDLQSSHKQFGLVVVDHAVLLLQTGSDSCHSRHSLDKRFNA